jgi:type VI secretion system protein ImpJ
MSSNKRVVWSEGMFLRPQHFQQHDRYFERYTELRAGLMRSNGWGFAALELDHDLLSIGKLALRSARGIFPDGTPFSMPDDDPLPPAVDVGINTRDKTAYLALPVRKAGAVDYTSGNSEAIARFAFAEIESRDSTNNNTAVANIEVGNLTARILLEGEPLDDYACIPLAQIFERGADQKVSLDPQFIPTVLRLQPAAVLRNFMEQLLGLLHQRAQELAGRAAEIGDILFLQACNRWEPLVQHWSSSLNLHPEDLYCHLVSLVGELAALTSESRRPPQLAVYQHDRLRLSFDPIFAALRNSFVAIIYRKAEMIPLTARPEIGVWQGIIRDKTLIDSAMFVLAVYAEVNPENIRRHFHAQSKVAAVENLRRYIMEMIAGIPLTPLPQVPRQIPLRANYVYFELDTRSPRFKELRTSGGIAIQVAGQFPGIMLELWAIRS